MTDRDWFAATFERGPMGALLLDPRGRIERANRAFQELIGVDDELAVCEDISPVGMCFRSKRRYDSNSAIQVAVPYSPDSANIFLPARVIYSEEMPKAGLFRHGTEYSKVGPRAR